MFKAVASRQRNTGCGCALQCFGAAQATAAAAVVLLLALLVVPLVHEQLARPAFDSA